MKKLLPFFLLALSSCIVIKQRPADDGYILANKQQFISIADSASANLGMPADTFSIREITASELNKSILKSDNALVVIWASWCGHCILELPSLIQEAKDRDIYFVSSTYDLKYINKTFAKEGYNKPVYIISASAYGSNEAVKTLQFEKELGINDSIAIFPTHLYFKNGKYAGKVIGGISPELMYKLFPAEEKLGSR